MNVRVRSWRSVLASCRLNVPLLDTRGPCANKKSRSVGASRVRSQTRIHPHIRAHVLVPCIFDWRVGVCISNESDTPRNTPTSRWLQMEVNSR
jgi:hypothetical protein